MADFENIIKESFCQYSGAVIQSRALVDARDGLKPSARQIFYSMLQNKLVHKNPFKKTMNAVGRAMADYYIHGDSSAEGIIMRASQSFAMRYPLVEVNGNGGTMISTESWAAPRYTESRLSKLSEYLFQDIDKDTISEWRDNYDNTKQYPAVLPTKGFYNIVNGTQGIAVGMASSIPQYNLRELNNALIYLIDNPNCDFEDIYVAPDFATGGILYNENEVKESMKNGTGFACKLRSVVDFDAKERCFIVTEIPYNVYTNTICGQLENIINSDDNPGIERFNDLTGEKPLIKIYLSKKSNPDKVLKYLYKETSLQYYYGINFTMLDGGKTPKVFTWKEMLQAHIDHEREVYRNGFEFDLNKIKNRIHIIDGLITCLAQIDEVVATIKASVSVASASVALQQNFLLDEIQASAVLEMKLSRLAHLEVKKLEDEREKLELEFNRINNILNNEELFKNELKSGWKEVSEKFGDERRTKIISLSEGDNNEPLEEKQLSLYFSNMGAVYVSETSTLYSQRRNGVGTKFKLDKDEYIIGNIIGKNTDIIMFFTSHGNFYHMCMGEFALDEKQYISSFIDIKPYEKIITARATSISSDNKNIIFITKNGILKKSEIVDYNLHRNAGAIAIKLDDGDEIVSVLFTNDEDIAIASRSGNFIMIHTDNINAIGRVARGVAGIKLNENDYVVSARTVRLDTKYVVSVTEEGYIKRTPISEFKVTGRNTKGVKLQSGENICDFILMGNESDLLVVSANSQIRISLNEVPILGREARGVKSIKLSEGSKITKICLI